MFWHARGNVVISKILDCILHCNEYSLKNRPIGSIRGAEEESTKGLKPSVEGQSSPVRNKPTTQLSSSPSLNTSGINAASAHYTSSPNNAGNNWKEGGVPNHVSQSSLGGPNYGSYGHNSTVSSFSSQM